MIFIISHGKIIRIKSHYLKSMVLLMQKRL